MPLTAQNAAAAFATASQLAEHSIKQAKTAYEMCAAVAIERLRLTCPPTDEYDIRRLRASMASYIDQMRDPITAIKRVAEKGELDFHFSLGESRAKPSLRAACRLIGADIEAAHAKAPSELATKVAELEAQLDLNDLTPNAAEYSAPKPKF